MAQNPSSSVRRILKDLAPPLITRLIRKARPLPPDVIRLQSGGLYRRLRDWDAMGKL